MVLGIHMRDPKRIPIILKELERFWQAYPDLRLGQLLYNATYPNNIFYYEDDELIKRLKAPKQNG